MRNFQKITSRDNAKLKFARSVRDGRENSKIFLEGVRLCEEILKTNLNIQFVCISEKFLQNTRGIGLIETEILARTEILEIDDRIFETLSDTKTSQGIILVADKPAVGKEIIEQNLIPNSLFLLLHQINNPANLGAILRTAEAVGANGIIATKGTTDAFSTKAMRSAMGANLRLPLWLNIEYKEVIEWAKERNIQSVCADIRSKKSYLEIDWTVGKMLVLGSEGNGLTLEEQIITDESLIIPMENQVESLNVAVACGIVLFEAKRQRMTKK